MTRQERINAINRLCSEASCGPTARKVHFNQFVDRNWHPHPPVEFEQWWSKSGHSTRAVTAWNCQSFRDEYMESKGYGVA